MRSRITYANVMSTVAVVMAFGAGSWAVAAIPDRGGVYHACVSKRTGALRLVNTERSCRRLTERAIRWNRTGRTGRQGDPGTPGAAGLQGLQGLQGPPGKDGLRGASGATNVTVRSNLGTTASCNAGEVATGGGGVPDRTEITKSRPVPTTGTPTGWESDQRALPFDPNNPQFQPTTYVVCAKP
jgi:hypothetical protein